MRRNFSESTLRDDGEGRGFVRVDQNGASAHSGSGRKIRRKAGSQQHQHFQQTGPFASSPPGSSSRPLRAPRSPRLPTTAGDGQKDDKEKNLHATASLDSLMISPRILTAGNGQIGHSNSHSHTSLEAQVRLLSLEIASLKRKIDNLESVEDRWGLRYSRRVATLTNVWIGLILFGSTFLERIRMRRQMLIPLLVAGTSRRKSKSEQLSRNMAMLISEGAFYALQQSAIFWLAAFLLMRKASWKRVSGITISSLWSLYMATFSKVLPWTNYFNLFANFVYVTCAFNISSSSEVATLKDYVDV